MITDVLPNEFQQVVTILQDNLGVRLGDTAVISTKVHVLDPHTPDSVYILVNSDAGQTFYHRKKAGEVIHMDVFHEIGKVNHSLLANAVKTALAQYRHYCELQRELSSELQSLSQLLNFIDIQTATGGGRVTGRLTFGQKRTLQKAHLTHCHLTLKLPPKHFRLLFYLVDNVEACIYQQGLELRKVEQLIYEDNQGPAGLDLSPYRDQTDSYLTESSYGQYQKKAWALEEALQLGGFDYQILPGEFDLTPPSSYNSPKPRLAQQKAELEKANKYELGKSLKQLNSKTHLEKIIFFQERFAGNDTRPNKYNLQVAPTYRNSTFRARKTTSSPARGALATAKTIKQALRRHCTENHKPSNFTILNSDVRYYYQVQRRSQNIAVVLDCSESMSGNRLQAAQAMIVEILKSSKDKVAVIAVQENNTRILCPFTRNRLLIQEKMSEIQPQGLTPIASGLEKAYAIFNTTYFRNPSVLLITDGVPTLSIYGYSPVEEAELAAHNLALANISFACIGLKPNKNLLQRIAAAGQGTLYIIEELKLQQLFAIYQTERNQSLAQGRN